MDGTLLFELVIVVILVGFMIFLFIKDGGNK
jgi:hypothetical protein